MKRRLRRFLRRFQMDEHGATAIEYGLIVALISLAILSALTLLGGGISGVFSAIRNTLEGVIES